MSDEERIAELEQELTSLRAAQVPSERPSDPATAAPGLDDDGIVSNVKIVYEVGTAAVWRPAKKKVIDPEKLIWGSNPPHRRRRFPRIGA
jgi:hypothetical protein